MSRRDRFRRSLLLGRRFRVCLELALDASLVRLSSARRDRRATRESKASLELAYRTATKTLADLQKANQRLQARAENAEAGAAALRAELAEAQQLLE